MHVLTILHRILSTSFPEIHANNWGQTTVSCSEEIFGGRPRFLVPCSSRHLQFNFFPCSGRQCDQHVQTEFLELAAYQVGDPRLRDA